MRASFQNIIEEAAVALVKSVHQRLRLVQKQGFARRAAALAREAEKNAPKNPARFVRKWSREAIGVTLILRELTGLAQNSRSGAGEFNSSAAAAPEFLCDATRRSYSHTGFVFALR